MKTHPVELTQVIYNAATQAFEARATVHDKDGARSYACAIEAPIDMDFDRASEGLQMQALRRHAGRTGKRYLPSGFLKAKRVSALPGWYERMFGKGLPRAA